MKVAFITEMGFVGKVQSDHPNMRTEFAWMNALNADHHSLYDLSEVIDYDVVFILFPKGKVYLSAEGSRILIAENPVSRILESDFVRKLQRYNKKVYYIQEGPHWWFNDYELIDQIRFYNLLVQCDGIFAHNEIDAKYYKGLVPGKKVEVIPTLIIEDTVKHIIPSYKGKAIIGGNFARWYGGFESYTIASEFKVPIWTQTSHATRDLEDTMENLNHLPRLLWSDWMGALSEFKYAVHLMPTIAAGTFSLNCAYFGIPCIGNKDVDTQMKCHPNLSVDVNDLEGARNLAIRLKEDETFWKQCSEEALCNFKDMYGIKSFLNNITNSIG